MLHASVTALLEALAAIERQIPRFGEQLKAGAALAGVLAPDERASGRSERGVVLMPPPEEPAPSKAQRRSLSGAHDQALHFAGGGGRDSAPIRLKFFAAEGSVIRL